MCTSFMFLAEGFEETEAIATFDIILRGGINIKTVYLGTSKLVKGAHGIGIEADISLDEFLKLDMSVSSESIIVFPGGMPGATNLRANDALMEYLMDYYSRGGKVAAICAAPSVVLSVLPLEGTKMTCYDGFEDAIREKDGIYTGEDVVNHNRIISAKGLGQAVDFGLNIVADLVGVDKAKEISKSIMLN